MFLKLIRTDESGYAEVISNIYKVFPDGSSNPTTYQIITYDDDKYISVYINIYEVKIFVYPLKLRGNACRKMIIGNPNFETYKTIIETLFDHVRNKADQGFEAKEVSGIFELYLDKVSGELAKHIELLNAEFHNSINNNLFQNLKLVN